jgi:hypothetical protein
MDTVTLRAHFDGERILLDEPFELERNTKLIVIPLPQDQPDAEREVWLLFSRNRLEEAYGDDEVEYSLDLIKETNPEYEGSGVATTQHSRLDWLNFT